METEPNLAATIVPPPGEGHDHGRCREGALKVAAELCHQRGVRFTPLRRRVLELIWESHVPLGAYAILDHLQAAGKRVRPPTVYRALDFLKEQGLIHRIESQNAYLGCGDPQHPHSSQHLICQGCGKVTELGDRAVEMTLAAGARGKDFQLAGAAVEAHGFCHDCRQGAPDAAGSSRGENASGEGAAGASATHVQAPATSSAATSSGATSSGATSRSATSPASAAALKQGPTLIAAKGLVLHRGGVRVLDGVDLAIHAGEIVTIIGPNGSGKTTLVRTLLGLVTPEAGDIEKAEGLRIGYVPQAFAVDPNLPLTVRRFLAMAGRGRADIQDALRAVGMDGGILAHPIQNLSGGELRRVLLARALLRKPDVLILDEPVQGVDIRGQSELYRLINAVRFELGCAVLMISHDLRLVMAATDEVICLNHHVCCAGHPEAVSRHPEYLALFGEKADETSFAVYTHHHDHVHDVAGNAVPVPGQADEPEA